MLITLYIIAILLCLLYISAIIWFKISVENFLNPDSGIKIQHEVEKRKITVFRNRRNDHREFMSAAKIKFKTIRIKVFENVPYKMPEFRNEAVENGISISIADSGLNTQNFTNSQAVDLSKIVLLIPIRNEEINIEQLTQNLTYQIQQFPTSSIILVDDHSTDNSYTLLAEFAKKNLANVQLLKNEGCGKKMAIETAVKQSHFEYYLCTDADCSFIANRLPACLHTMQENKLSLACGLVIFMNKNKHASVLDNYQIMENQVLSLLNLLNIKNGNPMNCNGANLCFSREAFLAVGGYAGNQHISSGDDDFLLQKIHQAFPSQIGILPIRDASVQTNVLDSWSALFQQRIRWAQKSKAYPSKKTLVIQILFSLICLAFISLPLVGVWQHSYWIFTIWLAKILADLWLMNWINSRFSILRPNINILIISILQFFFIPFVGIATFFVKPKWKERVG